LVDWINSSFSFPLISQHSKITHFFDRQISYISYQFVYRHFLRYCYFLNHNRPRKTVSNVKQQKWIVKHYCYNSLLLQFFFFFSWNLIESFEFNHYERRRLYDGTLSYCSFLIKTIMMICSKVIHFLSYFVWLYENGRLKLWTRDLSTTFVAEKGVI
jgi:hypothetical protein